MQICIVGCGLQSTGLAGMLVQEPDVERVLFLGRRLSTLEPAVNLVKTLGGRIITPKIEYQVIDLTDIDAVAEAAKGCCLIFNGATTSLNVPLMKAALKIGANYMDIWTNVSGAPGIPYEETIDAQIELEEDFKKANLTAVPGCGLCGYNIMAVGYMSKDMDTVDSATVRMINLIDSTDMVVPMPAYQMFDFWMGAPGPNRLVDGKIETMSVLDSEEEYEFPAPIGKQTIFTFAKSPDPPLIHYMSRKPIHRIEAKMGIVMGGMEMKDIWFNAITEQVAKHQGAEDMFSLFAEPLQVHSESFGEMVQKGIIKDDLVCSSIEVIGKKDGNPVRHTIYRVTTLQESMAHLPWAGSSAYCTVGDIVIELAVALGREGLTEKGILNFVDLSDGQKWFERFRKRGLVINEKIEIGEGLF